MTDIIKAPNPILNTVCSDIDVTNPSTLILATDMVQTMLVANGLGLAAPQVGETVRMFCMKYGGTVIVMCNPIITRHGREKATDVEGCLSIPGFRIRVSRYKIITVQWTDLDGSIKKEKMRGMDARCVQHEIDHLNGILIASS